MNRNRIIQGLESVLLETFNEAQQIEGFTVSDDSLEIYRAESGNDGLFRAWLSDCRLREAEIYRRLTEGKQ